MLRRSLSLLVLLGLAATAKAHFVFVVPEPGGSKAKIILSEDLKPDEQVDVGLVGNSKFFVRGADGRDSAVTLAKEEHAYLTTLTGSGNRVIHGDVDLGVTQRGEGKPNILIYHSKTILGDAFDPKATLGEKTPVEMFPVGKPGAVKLKLLARGKPLPDSEITVIAPDGTEKIVKTDKDGLTELFDQSGRFGAWARFWETTPGERDGKKYDEVRHYATLVFDVPGTTAVIAPATGIIPTQLINLPEATSSFGAAVNDGWLYVYGGHIVPTHSYSTEAVSGRFSRLKLAGGTAWEPLAGGISVQGMNLATHAGKVYRIGGMHPRNKPDEPEDTQSVVDCARFDPATMKWETIPPLPQPRSSHDVVVVGDKLYVFGGWWLKGADGRQWLDTMLVLDLASKNLEWKSLPQPFKRRAIIVAANAGRIYVIGGFNEEAQMVQNVEIYDPATNAWSKGKPLPGDEGNAFSPAAGSHDGQLYVSVADGSLYKLDASRDWSKVGTGTPRIVHRLVSSGSKILVMGGASNGDNLDLMEAFDLSTQGAK